MVAQNGLGQAVENRSDETGLPVKRRCADGIPKGLKDLSLGFQPQVNDKEAVRPEGALEMGC